MHPTFMKHTSLAVVLGTSLMATVTMHAATGWADILPDRQTVAHATALWESGAMPAALETVDEGLLDHPESLSLHTLRGDILATFRGPGEAVQAYDRGLAVNPGALPVRWAKWSVLVRWGHSEDALEELRRIAQIDASNPLVQLRLAQELRKLDRLEESLEAYRQAVELAPDLLGWRLAMARARFDVLDYQGADQDVQYVLDHAPAGSALQLPAANLRSVIHESMDRGRRFTPALTPEATATQLKEWAALRGEAWKLFAAGRYQEAEPLLQKLRALNPTDQLATHQLGLTLMQLGRCQQALDVFGSVLNLNPSEEDYADTVYRMGQCLVQLEQWEDAFVHFQTLYDAAVEFEERNKGVQLPEGTRVLDKEKLGRWLDTVRPHIPELAHPQAEAGKPIASDESGQPDTALETLLAEATARMAPQKPLDTGAALMGRDADFSWFRFVIPAGTVLRDDFPTGAHEFIPLNANDSFPSTQPEIFLVFGLVSASYDAVPLSAQCFLEAGEMTGESHPMAQDQVMMAMNDQSGYFRLTPPEHGWKSGLYRCGLFAGEKTSAYTQADEVRFRILNPSSMP
jgi:tetratricopeptide (TPR) repeat protein